MRRLAVILGRLSERLAFAPRPTRTGIYFAGCGTLLFLSGSYYSENSFVLLSCIPLAMLTVNLVCAWFSVRKLDVRRELPGHSHAGEAVDVGLVVTHKGHVPRFSLELADSRLPDMYRDEPITLMQLAAPGQAQRVSYAAVFGRRGRHALGELAVSSTFPFGLARRTRKLPCVSETIVYPRPYRLSRTFERQLLRHARFFGESAASNRGQEEVFGVREYLPGLNVARIHWRTTARLGYPMVLELEGRQDASFLVMLDAFPVGDPATLRQRLEAAIGLCAGLAWYFTSQGVLFRFACHGTMPELSVPGRGDSHYHAVMEKLALAGFSERALPEWIEKAEIGHAREAPVLVTLGPKEHAEARVGEAAGAFVISVAEPDFSQYVSVDPFGRRSLAADELGTREGA